MSHRISPQRWIRPWPISRKEVCNRPGNKDTLLFRNRREIRMVRTLTVGLLLCGLFCLAAPVRAQDTEAHIAKALQTLNEIARLLDAVQARQAALAHGGNAAGSNASGEKGWTSLFDGASLAGWKRTEFAGNGKVHIEKDFRGGPSAIV